MSSRALLVVDAGSVKSFDGWAWQFTAFLSRFVSPSVPTADQFVVLNVHDSDNRESLPRLRSSPAVIDQPLSWARYVDFISRVRNLCSTGEADLQQRGSIAEWKKRMKAILQGALVEYNWDSEGDDFHDECDATKKTIAIFTSVPHSDNPTRDAFREDDIKEKLSELGIRLLFFDLSENEWAPTKSRKRSAGPPGLLNAFLRDMSGSLLNLMPHCGAECPPFPLDLDLEIDECGSLRAGSAATSEDTVSDDIYLDILRKAEGSPDATLDESSTDLEELSARGSAFGPDVVSTKTITVGTLLPGCHDASRVLCEVQSDTCVASSWVGKSFLRIGGCPDFDRNEMKYLLEMDKSWQFTLSNDAQRDIRNDLPADQKLDPAHRNGGELPAKQLLVGKQSVWIFHFKRDEAENGASNSCNGEIGGVACPIQSEHVRRVVKEAVLLLLQPSTPEDDRMSISTAVSADGEDADADAFMNSCLQMFKKNDGINQQKQPTKAIEKKFIKKFRNGQRNDLSEKPMSRKERILDQAEKQVQLQWQKHFEKKSGKRPGEAGSSKYSRGGRDRSRREETLPTVLKMLLGEKLKALALAQDQQYYALSRTIVRKVQAVLKTNCVDPSVTMRSAFETIKRHLFLDMDAIGEQVYEAEDAKRSEENLKAMRLQEVKFQAVLRLEVLASLVRKDDKATQEELGDEVGSLLDKLTSGSQGSNQIRAFLLDLLVPKYTKHHGPLLATLCSDCNVPMPKNLSRFMSPTSTDDDISNPASYSSEASRDSGPGFELAMPSNATAPPLAGGKGFRRISMPKRKKSRNDEPGPSFESAFGMIRGRETRRAAAVFAAAAGNAPEDDPDVTASGGERAKRNLFGTARAPLDPVVRMAMQNKRKYLKELGSSPRTPPNKRAKPRVAPSPQWAFSPRLRSRTKDSPGKSRLQDVPETPESTADPDENVVERTPLANRRLLRFQASGPSPARIIRVPSKPMTPGSPALFVDERPPAGPSGTPSRTPGKANDFVVAEDSPLSTCDNSESPVVLNFWDSVKSPGATRSPAVSAKAKEATKSLFMSPSAKDVDPDTAAMPPPAWTPSRPRTASAKKRGAASGRKESESSLSPRSTLSPINVATLDEQANFPSPKTPLSDRKLADPVVSPFRVTRSNSDARSSATKRLAL